MPLSCPVAWPWLGLSLGDGEAGRTMEQTMPEFAQGDDGGSEGQELQYADRLGGTERLVLRRA